MAGHTGAERKLQTPSLELPLPGCTSQSRINPEDHDGDEELDTHTHTQSNMGKAFWG